MRFFWLFRDFGNRFPKWLSLANSMWFGIAQRELIAHWETLRALGDQDAKAERTSVRECEVGALPPVVSQCVQGSQMRSQFALRNRTDYQQHRELAVSRNSPMILLKRQNYATFSLSCSFFAEHDWPALPT